MARTTVNFRGDRVEVIYTDHCYEPDTNAHVIDWHWADPDMPLEQNLTDAEWESIEDQIREISSSRREFDDDH